MMGILFLYFMIGELLALFYLSISDTTFSWWVDLFIALLIILLWPVVLIQLMILLLIRGRY
jgi:hypothetical protein